jgi:hypothetical protein
MQKTAIQLDPWRSFMETWQRQGISGTVREFDKEGLDQECINMRMLALREADDAMRVWAMERELAK